MQRGKAEYVIRITSVEIYNDQVRDLFQLSNEKLAVRWTKQRGFYLVNATIVETKSRREFLQVLTLAANNRVVASHSMNERTNRSHCIVTIYIDCKAQQEASTYGKLTIVDLAGSERVKDTQTTGVGLNEAGHINKSLYALKKVC